MLAGSPPGVDISSVEKEKWLQTANRTSRHATSRHVTSDLSLGWADRTVASQRVTQLVCVLGVGVQISGRQNLVPVGQ